MFRSSQFSSSLPSYAQRTSNLTLAVLLCLGLSACGDPATPPGPEGAGTALTTADMDPALLQPLTELGPCAAAPQPAPQEDVVGLVLPDGAVITVITRTDPVVTVQGWVPLTPIQLRVDYAERDGITFIQAEDEVWEAEVLVSTGDRRLFIKAQALCADASQFVAVVAPEDASEAVPVPAQAGG